MPSEKKPVDTLLEYVVQLKIKMISQKRDGYFDAFKSHKNKILRCI